MTKQTKKFWEIWSNIDFPLMTYKTPCLMGGAVDYTFREACEKFFGKNKSFNSDQLTYQGMGLYETQREALDKA